MTPLEILEETVAFYSEDIRRRAIYTGGCKYRTPDGRKCAVGRCLENYDRRWENTTVEDIMTGKYDRETAQFKKEYDLIEQGYNERDVLLFWGKIQTLHDNETYWDIDGVNDLGKKYIKDVESHIKKCMVL